MHMTLLRPLGLILALAALLFSSLLSASDAPEIPLSEIKPESKHVQATALVTHFITKRHYRDDVELNDALSREMFNTLLERLDPNRNYFLAEDIEQLSAYADKFDDYLKTVRLEPAFSIFKLFRTRLVTQLDYATSLLDEEFDFERDESYRFNREDAAWAADQAELNDIWRKRVKNDVLSLRIAGKKDDDIRDVLKKRYEVRKRGVTQLNADDVFQIVMNAFTATIEPHTTYFSPRTSENFQIHLSLSLEGIGAALRTENEFTVVQRIITGGPADRGGELQPEDRITGVAQGEDGEMVDVVAWRLEDVVDKIRGNKGSTVRLEILPKGSAPTDPRTEITLVRDKIKLEEQAAKKSVETLQQDGKELRMGVIDIPTFYLDSAALLRGEDDYRSTTRDVKRLIRELQADGIDGLIIDLRGDGGGALSEAVQLTGLFIEDGPVVQVRHNDGRVKTEEDADDTVFYRGPLVVLVDRYSASASEIFSGAIQDYKRGVIVGEPTFGKGTVQTLIDLNRQVRRRAGDLGQLKQTVAQFFRVSGDSTQNRGVLPDIAFPVPEPTEEIGESALDNALPWAKIDAAKHRSYGINDEIVTAAKQKSRQRIESDPGFEYLVAVATEAQHNREKLNTTLLEAKRRAEIDAKKAAALERTNRLREALGLQALEQAEDDEDGVDDAVAGSGSSEKDKDDDVPGDVWLREAVRITADLLGLTQTGSHIADTN